MRAAGGMMCTSKGPTVAKPSTGRGPMWALRGFHLRVVIAVTVVTSSIVLLSSAVMWRIERHHDGSNIRSLGDAIWWAMETITTVGYGDHHPTTVAGRWVAGGLMVIGVALVGVITATVVTWFFSELDVLREVREIEAEEEKAEATLADILAQLTLLNERLDRLERRGRES
jgi:voltage-gated potassium channel